MSPSTENETRRESVNGSFDPVIGYAWGAAVGSLTYVALDALLLMHSGTSQTSLGFNLAFISFFLLPTDFAPALLLMILPWRFAVSVYRKVRLPGQLYFPGVGALLVFVLGCTTASLAPKPLFVEDQTFLQGAAIAAERQGIAFLLAGLAFGACYWFFGERQSQLKTGASPRPTSAVNNQE